MGQGRGGGPPGTRCLRSRWPRAWLIALGLLVLGAGVALGAEIVDLVPVVRDERIFVSYRVEEAFTDEIEHAIATGLTVGFRYNVELKRVRSLWLDRSLAARRIEVSVTYDNLTKRYTLKREVDGELDATEMVVNANAMRRFMTTFESLGLFDVSLMEPNEEYYLRVNAVTRDRNLLLFIPWDVGAGWKEAHFTYVP